MEDVSVTITCFIFLILWTMATSRSCMKCVSVKPADDSGKKNATWPVLPPSLKEDKACEKAADSNPLVTCNDACVFVKATLTAVETNGTRQRVIPYKTVTRGCSAIDASDGKFCSTSDELVKNLTQPLIKAIDDLQYLEITDVKGEACFCDKNACKPFCADGVFELWHHCALVWHFVVAGVCLLIILCCCCCCHTRCFCKVFMRSCF